MFETITQEKYRTFKEINKYHDMICVEELESYILKHPTKKTVVEFHTRGCFCYSDEFDNDEEALKFIDRIMGWNNDK